MLARKVEAKDLNNIFDNECVTTVVHVVHLIDKLKAGDHVIRNYFDKYNDENCQHHNGIYIGHETVITFNRDLVATQKSIDILEQSSNGLYTKCSLSDFCEDSSFIFIVNYIDDTKIHRENVIKSAKRLLYNKYRPYKLTLENAECFAFYCWTMLQIPHDLVYDLVKPKIKKHPKSIYFDNMFNNKYIPYVHKTT